MARGGKELLEDLQLFMGSLLGLGGGPSEGDTSAPRTRLNGRRSSTNRAAGRRRRGSSMSLQALALSKQRRQGESPGEQGVG